jgi:phosphonate transport system substrate-binding protein
LITDGQIKKGEIKQIWTSEMIPNSPVAVSTKISPALQQKIRNVYLKDLNVDALKKMGMCDKSDKTGDCDLGGWGYVPVTDKDYDGIRAVCKFTKADACTNIG